MKDKEFLTWLYYRLINVHKENCNVDYMTKFASIINKTDPNKISPNIDSGIK